MRGKIQSFIVCFLLIVVYFTTVNINFKPISNVDGATIYVPSDYISIQEAINAANEGDTVYVYSWTYNENIVINKTINLIGENRETTVIFSASGHTIRIEANWVNITGFTISGGNIGIYMSQSSNCNISNCKVTDVMPVDYTGAIHLVSSSNYNTFTNCNVSNTDANGIYIESSSNYNIITNCNVSGNDNTGIRINGGKNITIASCNVLSNGEHGIRLSTAPNCNIFNTNVSSNNYHGIFIDTNSNRNLISNCKVLNNSKAGIVFWGTDFNQIEHCNISSNTLSGIEAFSSAVSNIIINSNILSNKDGVRSIAFCDVIFTNSTIMYSSSYDIYLDEGSQVTTLNTTFNKTKVFYNDQSSSLTVKWFLHAKVVDNFGNPIRDAGVIIKNLIDDEISNKTTDIEGLTRWIPCIEYIGLDQNGDGDDFDLNERMYNTPHNVTATKNESTGYASPEPFMNKSTLVTIVLYLYALIDLELGWNSISLPRIQSSTNLQTVLQSIEGQYDAVQRYNATDTNDPWKYYHISKPSNLNDLDELDPSMGFWIHISDPGGTTLAISGEEFTTDQIIPLHKGWNHVGYPSSLTRVPDFGLPPSVDIIQWYNGSSGQWECWDPGSFSSDNLNSIKPGNGLWIHCTQVYDEWVLEHTPQVDWIDIVDTAGVGGITIPSLPIIVDQTIWGYAAAFNISSGYIGDIIVTWSVQNSGGANASTNPTIWDSSGFYSGDSGGTAIWTADDGNSHTDSITITIIDP